MKILHVIPGGVSYGGVESFLCNTLRHMKEDCIENAVLSVFSAPEPESFSEIFSRYYSLGCETDYVSFREKRDLFCKLKRFFRGEHWDVVHVHGGVLYAFFLCMILPGDTAMICHVHVQHTYGGKAEEFLLHCMKKVILRRSAYIFGCSEEAVKSWFGETVTKNRKYKIAPNAIETERFSYDPTVREKMRDTDRFVFGYVSRVVKGKNHPFLLDVFEKIHANRPDTELWLVGDGDKKESIREYAQKLHLSECVRFFGGRNDVPELLQAMDAFVFPSAHEGFGIVAVEAQAAGLPVYASDGVPEAVALTDLVRFLPLSAGADAWADFILRDMEHLPQRRNTAEEIKAAGYDIEKLAADIEEMYLDLSPERGAER